MIVVDTSVWADHLRAEVSTLAALLDQDIVLLHPFVLGELALGNLTEWDKTVADLAELPRPRLAASEEILHLIRQEGLMGSGIGWIDVSLLASVRLTPGARLWSRDRRLAETAAQLGIGFTE